MNIVGRFIVALAVALVLGVDDFEEDWTVDKPNGIDPEAWARYNESQKRSPDGARARCECSMCETCQRRHAAARAVVNDALAKALREESAP